MKVIIESDVLMCPVCGCENLHHRKVEYCSRNEDEPDGMRVVIEPSCVKSTHGVLSGNPSSRRGAICIGFYCEMCNDTHVMNIIQHKGITFITWA